MNFPKKIILTGAPGTGKTTVLNLLKAMNLFCLEETSREIILQAKEKGIENIFTQDPYFFSKNLLHNRKQQYTKSLSCKDSYCFFDRGIPDIIAYLDFVNLPITTEFQDTFKTYPYDVVFIFEPWQKIYQQDNERMETFEQATIIHTHITKTYQKTGIPIYTIPLGSPEDRLAFILNTLTTNYAKQ